MAKVNESDTNIIEDMESENTISNEPDDIVEEIAKAVEKPKKPEEKKPEPKSKKVKVTKKAKVNKKVKTVIKKPNFPKKPFSLFTNGNITTPVMSGRFKDCINHAIYKLNLSSEKYVIIPN